MLGFGFVVFFEFRLDNVFENEIERINTLQHYYVARNLWGSYLILTSLCLSLHELSKHRLPYNSKKVLAGLFSIAMILLLSLVMLKMPSQVCAETSIPKPTVPEFTVSLVDSSYDVPTTYSTNPYTGEKVTHSGYRAELRTIEIKIKNQPFTPFVVEEATANWTVGLQYVIRWKGYFEQDWHEIYYDDPMDGFTGFSANLESEYSVISFEGEYSSTEGLRLYYQGLIATFPPDAKVDFQVKARIGYVSRYPVPVTTGWIFIGEESGWSNTQTITIGANAAKPSENPTTPDQSSNQTTPQTELYGIIAILGAIIATLLIVIVAMRRKSGLKPGTVRDMRIADLFI